MVLGHQPLARHYANTHSTKSAGSLLGHVRRAYQYPLAGVGPAFAHNESIGEGWPGLLLPATASLMRHHAGTLDASTYVCRGVPVRKDYTQWRWYHAQRKHRRRVAGMRTPLVPATTNSMRAKA
jgi:hypothetical protein